MEQERAVRETDLNRVQFGATDLEFTGLTGRTIEQVRRMLQMTVDVPEDARVLADGNPVDEQHVIASGEVLEFIREAGKKGIR